MCYCWIRWRSDRITWPSPRYLHTRRRERSLADVKPELTARVDKPLSSECEWVFVFVKCVILSGFCVHLHADVSLQYSQRIVRCEVRNKTSRQPPQAEIWRLLTRIATPGGQHSPTRYLHSFLITTINVLLTVFLDWNQYLYCFYRML